MMTYLCLLHLLPDDLWAVADGRQVGDLIPEVNQPVGAVLEDIVEVLTLTQHIVDLALPVIQLALEGVPLVLEVRYLLLDG